jgi:hypothetical protein
MAILRYCPGTLPLSLGEGSIDALLGIIGGLVGNSLGYFLNAIIELWFQKLIGKSVIRIKG